MGYTEEGQTLLQSAIANVQATGERFLLWRLRASLGRLYRVSGRQSDAEAELATARELATELAGTIPEGGMRDHFLKRAYGMVNQVKMS